MHSKVLPRSKIHFVLVNTSGIVL